MFKNKGIAVWFMLSVFCFFGVLYAQSGETAAGIERTGAAGASRNQAINAGVNVGAGQNNNETTGQKNREGVSGQLESQVKVNKTDSAKPQAEPAGSSGADELVDGIFNVTQSDIGNPIFTKPGKILKQDNFIGSGFIIQVQGKTLIPLNLKPQFQVEGMEVIVCYEPVAYTGAGAGPIVVSIVGIRAVRTDSDR